MDLKQISIIVIVLLIILLVLAAILVAARSYIFDNKKTIVKKGGMIDTYKLDRWIHARINIPKMNQEDLKKFSLFLAHYCSIDSFEEFTKVSIAKQESLYHIWVECNSEEYGPSLEYIKIYYINFPPTDCRAKINKYMGDSEIISGKIRILDNIIRSEIIDFPNESMDSRLATDSKIATKMQIEEDEKMAQSIADSDLARSFSSSINGTSDSNRNTSSQNTFNIDDWDTHETKWKFSSEATREEYEAENAAKRAANELWGKNALNAWGDTAPHNRSFSSNRRSSSVPNRVGRNNNSFLQQNKSNIENRGRPIQRRTDLASPVNNKQNRTRSPFDKLSPGRRLNEPEEKKEYRHIESSSRHQRGQSPSGNTTQRSHSPSSYAQISPSENTTQRSWDSSSYAQRGPSENIKQRSQSPNYAQRDPSGNTTQRGQSPSSYAQMGPSENIKQRSQSPNYTQRGLSGNTPQRGQSQYAQIDLSGNTNQRGSSGNNFQRGPSEINSQRRYQSQSQIQGQSNKSSTNRRIINKYS